MSGEFSKSLLKAAASDVPAAGARARALASIDGVVAASSVATATAAKGVAAKSAYAFALTAIVAGGVGLGGGYALGRGVNAVTPKPSHAETSRAVEEPARAEHRVASPATSSIASPITSPTKTTTSGDDAAADVCADTTAESHGACSVDGGKTVTFALKSTCTSTRADLFWVDTSCREIFRGTVAPSETIWADSWEGHVFRLRDHATHRLIREFSPTAVDGAPDRDKSWKGPPTELPLVTVAQSQAPIAEGPPAECTHGGGRGAVLHVKNDRTDGPIAVSLVDFASCQERNPPAFVRPGEKLDMRTSEGHAYRVRNAEGQLVLDIPPTSLDTTTYLTLP
ncbi:MAG TPA: hypothetical protein VF407_14145 [Polyangiaceae bacterium]